MKRLLLPLAALILVAASGMSPSQVAIAYLKAVDAGDLAGAKTYLTAGKLKAIASKSDDEAMAELSVLSPRTGTEVDHETINGDEAIVTVVTHAGDAGRAVGTLKLAKEKGQWRVRSEMWDIGGEPDATPTGATPANLTPAQQKAWHAIEEAGYPNPSAEQFANAAAHGDLPTVKHFLEAGFEVDAKGDTEYTPLFISSMNGNDAVALYLLTKGANPNVEDDVHTTPLMRAASRCSSTKLIKALLAAGATTSNASAGGATAEQLAHYSNCSENEAAIRAARARKK